MVVLVRVSKPSSYNNPKVSVPEHSEGYFSPPFAVHCSPESSGDLTSAFNEWLPSSPWVSTLSQLMGLRERASHARCPMGLPQR